MHFQIPLGFGLVLAKLAMKRRLFHTIKLFMVVESAFPFVRLSAQAAEDAHP